MDQTGRKICFNTKGTICSTLGEKNIWYRTTKSGQDKRQCTVQLTHFAGSVPRVKLCVTFKGTVQTIAAKERKQYDNRVVLQFHKSTSWDEVMILHCLKYLWNASGTFLIDKRGRMSIYDVHQGRKTSIEGTQ